MRAGTRQTVQNQPTGQTLVHDTFTDSNGTAIAAHVIQPVNRVGATWTVFGASVTIQSNQALTGGNYTGATVDLGTPDAEIVLTFTHNTITGVIGRYRMPRTISMFRCKATSDFMICSRTKNSMCRTVGGRGRI
jgi:hypothetical protein